MPLILTLGIAIATAFAIQSVGAAIGLMLAGIVLFGRWGRGTDPGGSGGRAAELSAPLQQCPARLQLQLCKPIRSTKGVTRVTPRMAGSNETAQRKKIAKQHREKALARDSHLRSHLPALAATLHSGCARIQAYTWSC